MPNGQDRGLKDGVPPGVAVKHPAPPKPHDQEVKRKLEQLGPQHGGAEQNGGEPGSGDGEPASDVAGAGHLGTRPLQGVHHASLPPP